jgi:hypothetical protein
MTWHNILEILNLVTLATFDHIMLAGSSATASWTCSATASWTCVSCSCIDGDCKLTSSLWHHSCGFCLWVIAPYWCRVVRWATMLEIPTVSVSVGDPYCFHLHWRSLLFPSPWWCSSRNRIHITIGSPWNTKISYNDSTCRYSGYSVPVLRNASNTVSN